MLSGNRQTAGRKMPCWLTRGTRRPSYSNPSSRIRHGIAFGCVWRCTARNSNARTRTCESTSVRIMPAQLARGRLAASRLALHPGDGQLVVPRPQRESLVGTHGVPELPVRVPGDDRTGRRLSPPGTFLRDPAEIAAHLAHHLVGGASVLELDDPPLPAVAAVPEQVDRADRRQHLAARPAVTLRRHELHAALREDGPRPLPDELLLQRPLVEDDHGRCVDPEPVATLDAGQRFARTLRETPGADRVEH